MVASLPWLFLHERHYKGTPVLHHKLIKYFLLILLQVLMVKEIFLFLCSSCNGSFGSSEVAGRQVQAMTEFTLTQHFST